MSRPVIVGVSLKTYFSHAGALAWFDGVAARLGGHEAIAAGAVRLIVLPTFLQVPAALAAFAGTPVQVGAQDVSAHPAGAFTGEVAASELAEVGVAVAEVGHAERRRLFGETDVDTAAKVTAALEAGLTPLLCLGETERLAPDEAARIVVDQLHASLGAAPGPVIVAYEPVWAIGADAAAPAAHVVTVARALRQALDALPDRAGSAVVYGGSAGPGVLDDLGDAVDGVFLGRFAHDPAQLERVIDEAGRRARAGAPS